MHGARTCDHDAWPCLINFLALSLLPSQVRHERASGGLAVNNCKQLLIAMVSLKGRGKQEQHFLNATQEFKAETRHPTTCNQEGYRTVWKCKDWQGTQNDRKHCSTAFTSGIRINNQGQRRWVLFLLPAVPSEICIARDGSKSRPCSLSLCVQHNQTIQN